MCKNSRLRECYRVCVSPPPQQDGESKLAYARRLAADGHTAHGIRFSLTLPAGMVAALGDCVPDGMSLQDATKTMLVAGLDHRAALDELEQIREFVAGIEQTLADVRDGVQDEKR